MPTIVYDRQKNSPLWQIFNPFLDIVKLIQYSKRQVVKPQENINLEGGKDDKATSFC